MSNNLPLMPTECLIAFIEISEVGAKKGYSPDSWKAITPTEHVLRGARHLLSWLLKDNTEEHIKHAMWRICAAVALLEQKK